MFLRNQRMVGCIVALVIVSCGSDGTGPKPLIPLVPPVTPPVQPPASPTIASIQINYDGEFLTAGTNSNVTAVALSADGTVLGDQYITFTSSDVSRVRISSPQPYLGAAVVSGINRGAVTITAQSGTVTSSVVMFVRAAKLLIEPLRIADLAIGESVQLVARLTDALGAMLPDQDTVSWLTHWPSSAALSQSGLVTALPTAYEGSVWVYAWADGLQDSVRITLHPVVAGKSAAMRFVHAAEGLPPVTFGLSNGSVVTLAFGESREVAVNSGGFRVDVAGLPPIRPPFYAPPSSFSGIVLPNEHSTFYVTGEKTWAALTKVSDAHDPLALHQTLVRVMVAGGIPSYAGVNVYLKKSGETGFGEALGLCYDVYGETKYLLQSPATYEIAMFDPTSTDCYTPLSPGSVLARFNVQPQPGHATTYVITGVSTDRTKYGILTIVDP